MARKLGRPKGGMPRIHQCNRAEQKGIGACGMWSVGGPTELHSARLGLPLHRPHAPTPSVSRQNYPDFPDRLGFMPGCGGAPAQQRERDRRHGCRAR
jgi:hypothetical protein